jgi:hypothetical protein
VIEGEATLLLAEQVVKALELQGLNPLLIGAAALAAHGYSRSTEDVDLAIAIPRSEMKAVFERLRAAGFTGHHHPPDGQDPLGGS